MTTVTIWRWQSKHKAFCSALKVTKGAYDERVVRSLAQRAVGYSYTAVKIHHHEGVPVVTEYVEHVPADVSAAKLWLTNRRPDEWRDKSETVQKLDASDAFLKMVQLISGNARAKAIEGKTGSRQAIPGCEHQGHD